MLNKFITIKSTDSDGIKYEFTGEVLECDGSMIEIALMDYSMLDDNYCPFDPVLEDEPVMTEEEEAISLTQFQLERFLGYRDQGELFGCSVKKAKEDAGHYMDLFKDGVL